MGQHDRLIDQLFKSGDDRDLARAFVDKFGEVPGMSDRVPALLQEAARSADQVGGGTMSPENARAYLSDFASTALGTPAHVMADLTSWFDSAATAETPPDSPAEQAQPQPAADPAQAQNGQPAQPAPAAAPARLATATPTRVALQQEISRHQANLRAPEGSPEWRAYWKDGGSVAYAEALRAMETAPETAAAPTLAGGGEVPAQTSYNESFK